MKEILAGYRHVLGEEIASLAKEEEWLPIKDWTIRIYEKETLI